MAAERYEDIHRHLRETLAQRGAAWREGEEDGSEVIAASRRLDAFHECTGPLMDDLVAAVRKLSARPIEGTIPAGITEVFSALAALDEASGRG